MDKITKDSTMQERLEHLYGEDTYQIDTAVVEVERVLCAVDDINDHLCEVSHVLGARLDRLERRLLAPRSRRKGRIRPRRRRKAS